MWGLSEIIHDNNIRNRVKLKVSTSGSVMISSWQTEDTQNPKPRLCCSVAVEAWHQCNRKWTSTSLFFLSSGGAVPVNEAVGLGGVEASQPSHALPVPFVRARLSPSPAVKGRIVAPAASLVLMSPDANLTHGWSLNNHFLYSSLNPSPFSFFYFLSLFLSFLLSFIFFFFLNFSQRTLYIPSPQFPRQLMRYN